MLERAVNNCSLLSRLDSFLKGIISSINDTPLKRIVGHCPTTVSTRWLSRIRAIDWILRKEEMLKDALNHEWIQSAEKRIKTHAMQGITFERFETLRVFAHAIFPFFCAIKYFEADSTTQASIFPVTQALLRHFESLKDEPMFAGYPGVVECLIEGIQYYIHECYDWPLLTLLYMTTLEGRAWFIKEMEEYEWLGKWNDFKKIELDFNYSTTGKPIFNADNEHEDEQIPQQPNGEQDLIDNFIQEAENKVIPEEAVEEEVITTVIQPPQEKVNQYDNALESLIQIAADMNINSADIPKQFATWMFDPELDSYIWKCREVPITDIWASFSGDNRIKEMRRVISRVLTARATEASVEREFSREKLILGRLRSRMGGKLLKSRSILMESMN